MHKRPVDRQKMFREMVLGTLLYSVVLGFFNDYTDILYTGTYSTTFAAAFVLQVLTYLTFDLKKRIVAWFRHKQGSKVGMAFSVWLVMFLSKFVFLEAINIVFRGQVEISGFIGLLVIVASLTIAQKLIELVDKKLEN